MRRFPFLYALMLAAVGAGCGADPDPNPPTPPPEQPKTFKLGGSVSGIAGGSIRLEAALPGGVYTSVSPSFDGPFEFPATLKDGTPFDVDLYIVYLPEPGTKVDCDVQNGEGVIAGADFDSIKVKCTFDPPPRSIGGKVSGLKGSGLVLQNNGADDLSVAMDGPFEFATKLAKGSTYNVKVLSQPTNPAQTCTATKHLGTVDFGDVTDVMVTCVDDPPIIPTYPVGGTVVGLKGTGLVLQNNGGDDLGVNQNGTFAFGTNIEEGAAYDVTVAQQPTNPAQFCFVTSGAGTVTGAVADVVVTCSVDPKTVDVSNADRCDFLDPAHCLYPFPNDHFTVADPTTPSGRRVALKKQSMPVNKQVDLSPAAGLPVGTIVSPGDVTIDPAEWNKNDGFSPGQMLLTYVPKLDLAASKIGQVNYVERSLEPDSPLVIIDAETLERHLAWGELDSYATSDATRSLVIRAGQSFREGHRYIVALRNLKDKDGAPIEPGAAFQVYRDAVPSTIPEIEARRAHMEELFGTLAEAGVERKELYLTWDFTTISEKNLTERMLHIRDDAFASLADQAPAFTITKVTQNPDGNRSRRIEGFFTVPNYLNQNNGVSGASFNYDQPDDGLPDRLGGNGTLQANFICNIPRSALPDGLDNTQPVFPGRAALYGHGQQGDATQVNGGSATGELSKAYNFVFCATDFIGMSVSDNLNILQLVAQWGKMNTLSDRLQQGLLNNLFLARLMIHPQGFVSDANFRGGPLNQPLIDTSGVYYYGISQGGILGGALVAISQDIRKGALGVTGMNYSLLLDRATGFDDLRPFMDQAYTNEFDRRIIFSAMQMLWDRGETNGYAWHATTDPLPNTPPHELLMQDAFADHQVTQWSADIEARVIGAKIHTPALVPGRSIDVTPFYGIPAIGSYPYFGSAVFVWDTGPYDMALNKGTPAPPIGNEPLRTGVDPHGRPRVQPGARLQVSEFLKPTGRVIDPCPDAACQAN